MLLKEFMVKVQMFSEAPNSCDIVHFFFLLSKVNSLREADI